MIGHDVPKFDQSGDQGAFEMRSLPRQVPMAMHLKSFKPSRHPLAVDTTQDNPIRNLNNEFDRERERLGVERSQPNLESGTFGRLGIRGSGSGRNMLLPFARQLENQHLSPIQQTPPRARDKGN